MKYGCYDFACRLEDDAVLPEYKGSTFRGVFGIALRKVVCTLKNQECHECLLQSKCLYPRVFEVTNWPDDEVSHRMVSPPHPYVIEPAETNRTRFQKGESFYFSLILFGEFNDYLPYFIYAFDKVGKIGIGKRIEGKRASFSLLSVTAKDRLVYDDTSGKIHEGDCTEKLSLEKENYPVDTISLELLTPLRIKYESRLKVSLPFHVLTRAILRRISSLWQYYASGEHDLDYTGLIKRAQNIQICESSLRWFDWKRYSNRQDRSMLMGGLVGSITYAGDLSEYIPLLRVCEKVHLGKQTSFGLGKIEMGSAQ